MTVPPWLVLLLLVSLALALGYQLASRRYGWRVLGYWIIIFAALVAFEAGAEALGWNMTRFGDLRILPDAAGALLALLVLWFLGV